MFHFCEQPLELRNLMLCTIPELVLPNSHDLPALALQQPTHSAIALPVFLNLSVPVSKI